MGTTIPLMGRIRFVEIHIKIRRYRLIEMNYTDPYIGNIYGAPGIIAAHKMRFGSFKTDLRYESPSNYRNP